jgi:hypothetical protein
MSVQYDLSLTTTIPELNSLSAPKKGTGRIGIAKNDDVLYFRVFDSSGNQVVETDERSLKDKAQNIGELKKRLKGLWPPHVVSPDEKKRIIKSVRSVVSIKEIEDGLGILGTDAWFKLQAFVLQCKHHSPTTVNKMAQTLGMERPPNNPNWDPQKEKSWDPDYTKTTKDYFDLANYCDDSDLAIAEKTGFWNVIKPGMVGLADGIVSYQKTQDVIYSRLQQAIDDFYVNKEDPSMAEKLAEIDRLWNQASPPTEALDIKKKFISAFTRLHQDADERAKKAEKLEVLVTGFHNNLIESQGKFELDHQSYETKFGSESEKVKNIKLKKKGLEDELQQGRNKERDEIIVLGTSPIYLILWPIGPLIMAGIQIGVGVDLALLRAKIDTLVNGVDDLNKELTSKEKFITGYKSMKTMTEETSTSIKKILPAIAQLKDGWHALASDLEGIVEVLNKGRGDVEEQDWFMAATGLLNARGRWTEMADRADHFRKNATIREAASPKKFVEELKAA